MRKKDYELIAMAVKQNRQAVAGHNIRTETLDKLAIDLADVLTGTSPKFDKQKFLTGCGIEVEKPLVYEGKKYFLD